MFHLSASAKRGKCPEGAKGILVRVSVTTGRDHEFGNIEKCLAADDA